MSDWLTLLAEGKKELAEDELAKTLAPKIKEYIDWLESTNSKIPPKALQ